MDSEERVSVVECALFFCLIINGLGCAFGAVVKGMRIESEQMSSE